MHDILSVVNEKVKSVRSILKITDVLSVFLSVIIFFFIKKNLCVCTLAGFTALKKGLM